MMDVLSEAMGNFIVGMAVLSITVLCIMALKKHIEKEKK